MSKIINGELVHYIDLKGNAIAAQVASQREEPVVKAGRVVHDEPILTLTYPDPVTKVPQTKYDVVHFTHPSKDETNPAFPRIALHAWKRLDEEHIRPAADHPTHDHPFETAKTDEQGRVIPKARPLHEAHVADHLAGLPEDEKSAVAGKATEQGLKVAEHEQEHQKIGLKPTGEEKIQVQSTPRAHHPGNPETVKFSFACNSCGASVTRTAGHHGGKQWEPKPEAQAKGAVLGGDNSDLWQEHVCKQEDIDAFRKKTEDAKKPAPVELSPSERLAAGEQLAPEPTLLQKIENIVEEAEAEEKIAEVVEGKPEPDVITELQNAPPAPSETEKPHDAA